MASYNFTNGSIDGIDVPRKTSAVDTTPFVRRSIVDFSKQNVSSGDDVKVMEIDEGIMVTAVTIRVMTADSGGFVDVGYAASSTAWGDDVYVDTAGAVNRGIGAKYFDSDGGIYLTAGADLDTAKVEVIAECIKCIDTM